MQHSKLTPIGLPGKGYDGFCTKKRGPLVMEENTPEQLALPPRILKIRLKDHSVGPGVSHMRGALETLPGPAGTLPRVVGLHSL